MYRVTEFAEPRFSHNHGDVYVSHYRIVSLLNDNRGSGNALARYEVTGFDCKWIWHSRHGCLIL